eukprot:COSAG02_NODE_26631_length_628_cov_2.837429_2_plen_110_part_01
MARLPPPGRRSTLILLTPDGDGVWYGPGAPLGLRWCTIRFELMFGTGAGMYRVVLGVLFHVGVLRCCRASVRRPLIHTCVHLRMHCIWFVFVTIALVTPTVVHRMRHCA